MHDKPERARARAGAWRATHSAQHRAYLASHLEQRHVAARVYAAAWVAAHPAQARANHRNVRIRRRAAIGYDHVSAAEQAALLILPCAYCGAPATELDHIVPLRPRAGEPAGRHVRENLAPACCDCNRQKSNLPLDVWLARRAA